MVGVFELPPLLYWVTPTKQSQPSKRYSRPSPQLLNSYTVVSIRLTRQNDQLPIRRIRDDIRSCIGTNTGVSFSPPEGDGGGRTLSKLRPK
jgi:hypothetical protein